MSKVLKTVGVIVGAVGAIALVISSAGLAAPLVGAAAGTTAAATATATFATVGTIASGVAAAAQIGSGLLAKPPRAQGTTSGLSIAPNQPTPCLMGETYFDGILTWDTGYGGALEDMPFNWAALVLTQVIDRHAGAQTITTDLGLKAISDDGPLPRRATLLQNRGAEMREQNEEHGIFHWPDPQPEIGSYLLAVPGHVCPTTIRYPGSYVIDAEGQIADYYPHSARDRH